LRLIKEKIIRDQQLLVRNNEELEDELHKHRSGRQESSRGDELREKINKMKEKIAAVEGENNKIALRKKDLEKHIK
jgi:secreted PhoX family phosphatase